MRTIEVYALQRENEQVMQPRENAELPTRFDKMFFNWFCERTQATWSSYKTWSFAEFKVSRVENMD